MTSLAIVAFTWSNAIWWTSSQCPKLASLLHTDHQWQEMTLKDPEALLAVELALRWHWLHEQFPGTPALAISRKQAQSGRRLWPYQLIDGSKLALTKQKQQANQHPDARYVSCKTTISCMDGHPFRRKLLKSFSTCKEWGRKKKLAKIKFHCTSIYVCHQKHVLSGCL